MRSPQRRRWMPHPVVFRKHSRTHPQSKELTNISAWHIIYLPRQLGGRFPPASSLVEGVVDMSTYEEFMVILAVAGLIVSILNLKNKK